MTRQQHESVLELAFGYKTWLNWMDFQSKWVDFRLNLEFHSVSFFNNALVFCCIAGEFNLRT